MNKIQTRSLREILCVQSLKEMEDFMIDNSVPCKNRQKLMRNLRVSPPVRSLIVINS